MQNITALGPKNPWTANLLSALGIMHFSNEEIKETFDALTDRGDSIDKARVFELLRAAFGFEPMPEEMGLFVSALQLDEDGEVSWAELEDAFDQIRETLTGRRSQGGQLCSVLVTHPRHACRARACARADGFAVPEAQHGVAEATHPVEHGSARPSGSARELPLAHLVDGERGGDVLTQ